MNDINTISNRTIIRIMLVIVGFVGAIWLVFQLHQILTWIGIAFFLAVAVNPAVDFFAKYMPRKSRGLAAGIVFSLIVSVFAFLVVALVPPLINQTQALVKKVPDLSKTLEHSNLPIAEFARKYNLVSQIKANESKIASDVTRLSGSVLDLARTALSSFVATLTVLVLAFFMLMEGPKLVAGLRENQTKTHLAHSDDLMGKMYKAVTGWVTGNLLTSLISAVLTALMLIILRVPFSIPLGLLIGVFDLIPLVGATLGAIVVVVVCLFSSVTTGFIMLLFFLIYQQVENHVLQPLVYSRTIQLSPLLVMISALMGAELDGFVGALVAIPVAASLQILAKDLLAQRQLRRGKGVRD